jgi:serine/threonine protein kinase
VADFGLGVFTLNDEPLTKKCGTPGYVAPEILRSEGYSYKADIFSLGSLFFNLATSRYLFNGKDTNEMLINNMKCKL